VLQHADGCVPCGVKQIKASKGEADYTITGKQGATTIVTNIKTGRHHGDANGLETVDNWQCVDGCPVAVLDDMSGETKSMRGMRGMQMRGGHGGTLEGYTLADDTNTVRGFDDSGGASRFFTRLDPPFTYAAKASTGEKNDALSNLYWAKDDTRESMHRRITKTEWQQLDDDKRARGNIHPTVKNLALCDWLVRLISNPDDTVLDMFTGTASIGVAAVLANRQFVGIERNEDYTAIAQARLEAAWHKPQQSSILDFVETGY
jgi:hypothetical protein